MEQFTFSGKVKKITIILMAVGLVALIMGIANVFMAHDDHHHHVAVARLWSNILINSFFFFGTALAAMFFMTLQYITEAGWSVVIKRILEAISSFMPVGGIFLIVVFAAGTLHFHHLYHWMDPAVTNPDSPLFDEIIAGKSGYLNLPFFWFRALLFLGVWIWFWMRFRKRSLEEDLGFDRARHFQNVKEGAIFMVFFGYSSSAMAWDWIMSIDTHWFSTLFGWYTFSGIWLNGMVMTTVLALWLRKRGHLDALNASHIHDLGKWIFGVSFLWAYLFFSQFMLIWYANIPEEVTYFIPRIEDYTYIYWGMFAVNFLFPMIALMDRDHKRSYGYLMVIGCIVLVGHWLDTYMLVTPGTMQDHGSIGLFEIGLALGFLGLFVFVVLNTLSKAPLLAKNHPFYEESLHHEIH